MRLRRNSTDVTDIQSLSDARIGACPKLAVDFTCFDRHIGRVTDKPGKTSLSYAATGVDIKTGEAAVDRIKALAAKTFGGNVLSEIGSFGGFFKPDLGPISSPVLVSSTDSVGTKVKLAFMTNRHDTVGEDLVNHCINDILVHGAKPLFFLDYIGIHKVELSVVASLVSGLSRACLANGVALIGGETAELPEMYADGEYDLVGFVVGIVDESRIINGATIQVGDVCIGLASSGLHTNGYTLARKIAFESANLKVGDHVPELSATIDAALMEVHRCYASLILPLLDNHTIHGMAHITGGGIGGNLKRIIPDGLSAQIDASTWPELPIFSYLMQRGNVSRSDMFDAFNMGIGYIIVVPESESGKVMSSLNDSGEQAHLIGRVDYGHPKVVLA